MIKIKNTKVLANFSLILCAFIWGFAFVAQSKGMDYVQPFTFQSIRSFLGFLTLLPVVAGIKRTESKTKNKVENKKKLVTGGILCGIVLCIASCFQQFGILYTTVGKAGFITSMYLVLVPVFSIFLKRKVGWKTWLSVLIAMGGMYLLSMNEGFSISKGDQLVAVCAVCFALHIMLVDHYAPHVNGVKLSCIQFLVSGILSGIGMVFMEKPQVTLIFQAALPLLYAGVLSCGAAYTLQIIGQKYANPTTATLLMSFESVFSLLGGAMLLHQIPTAREAVGCVLVFAAVLLSQVSGKNKS